MARNTMGALILAAGKGTRMHSALPKVLHTLLGEPMLGYVLDAAAAVFGDRVWTVVGHGADLVRDAFAYREGFLDRSVLQAEQLGTGHALQCAWESLRTAGLDSVVVVNGDAPCITPQAIETLVNEAEASSADIAFMTLDLDDPASYGRVARAGRPDGPVTAIVEAKDLEAAAFDGQVANEVNAGVYWLRMDAMAPLLDQLTNANASGEFYITDLVGLAVSKGLTVSGVACGNDASLFGINSPAELVDAEAVLRRRVNRYWLSQGVIVRTPDTVTIGPRVSLEPGVEIVGPCELYGRTTIASGTVIRSHSVIRESEIGPDCVIKEFSHLEAARLENDCQVGPYGRLRPGAVMLTGSRVGNFVEMKKAVLGKGSKASHLTYLGDAEIGAGCNIGAGTITCNYDGVNKHKTVLGDKVFVGSNTALVAPVTVGQGALIGAGSTITKDVPEKGLAIARQKQKNLSRKGGA